MTPAGILVTAVALLKGQPAIAKGRHRKDPRVRVMVRIRNRVRIRFRIFAMVDLCDGGLEPCRSVARNLSWRGHFSGGGGTPDH